MNDPIENFRLSRSVYSKRKKRIFRQIKVCVMRHPYRWTFIFVSSLWLCSLGLLFLKEPGQFGDMFGAVNALFSGLAFAGVVIAILLQRQELKLQRKELKQTRQEFQQQTFEFEEQNKTLSIQKFDNTFFNMLNLLASIIDGTHFKEDRGSELSPAIKSIRSQAIDKHGRDVFTYFREKLNPELCKANSIEEFSKKVNDFFFCNPYRANNYVGHYFRVIYSTLKLIEQNRVLSFNERKSYSNILRAQLSNDELFLLFCNCAYRDDFLLFKLLIEKYSFLEHCYDFNLIDEIMNEYQSIAYQRDGKFDLYKYSSRLDNLGIKNFIIDECLIEE